MPCYHVRIRYKDSEQKYEVIDYELDLSEEDAKTFGEQYEEGQVFFKDKWIDALNIREIEIRETISKSTSYYPTLTSSTIFYGTRTDIKNATRKFIKLPPKKGEFPRKREKKEQPLSKNIFIVHGRDNKPALELARIVEKDLGLNSIILHEKPDRGRTIIEKLEDESLEVGYAFIILTPDDVGNLIEGFNEGKLMYRARQNVVLEFGYFIGLLGRNRVCCLHTGDIELPSDMKGIIYKPFKDSIKECFHDIVKDLTAAGYKIKV